MAPDDSVPFETLSQGDASDSHPFTGVSVARTELEWRQCWQQLMSGHSPSPGLPAVDWTSDMVIVFVLGVRGTGGYSARIERVRPDHEAVRVFVREERPGQGCFTTQALTNPYHAVTTARSDLPVEVVERVEVVDCD